MQFVVAIVGRAAGAQIKSTCAGGGGGGQHYGNGFAGSQRMRSLPCGRQAAAAAAAELAELAAAADVCPNHTLTNAIAGGRCGRLQCANGPWKRRGR